jgi:hypothetical protein
VRSTYRIPFSTAPCLTLGKQTLSGRLGQTLATGKSGGLTPVGNTELAEDVGDVEADRLRADEERLGDLPVGRSLHQQAENLDART